MDDTISRQAAIDAPFKKFDMNTGVTWIPLEHIEQLPSAQRKRTDKHTETHACDLISRQAAIDALHMHLMYRMGTDSNKKRLDDWINGVPSAQPEQRWIPCSERLPEDDTLMLVNYVDHGQYAMDIWIGWHEMENVWYIDGETHSEEFGNEVIAWMPLPEPYRGGERDD